MSDRPIIFSGPMVRALLDGRKTQTRRVLNPQPPSEPGWRVADQDEDGVMWMSERGTHCACRLRYAPGDRLYVREGLHRDPHLWKYRADGQIVGWPARRDLAFKPRDYMASIHMPRHVSRLTLTVTDVRVHRLQEISEEDARAEGAGLYVPGHGFITDAELHADPGYSNFLAPRMGFEAIWWEIHGPDAWAANPWVAALTFTVERRNIDEVRP